MRIFFSPRLPAMSQARKSDGPPAQPNDRFARPAVPNDVCIAGVQPAFSKLARFAGGANQAEAAEKRMTQTISDVEGTHPDFVALFLEGGNKAVVRSEKQGGDRPGGLTEEPDHSENRKDAIHDSRRWVSEALTRAAAAGRNYSVNKLLKREAELRFQDEKGETALMKTLWKGNPDLARQLTEHASAFVLRKDSAKPTKSRLGMQVDKIPPHQQDMASSSKS